MDSPSSISRSQASSAHPLQLQVAPPDTDGIKRMIDSMQLTVSTLGQNLDALNAQSSALTTLGPSMESAEVQIVQLGEQLQTMDARQEKKIERLKKLMREDLIQETLKKLDPLIQTQIQVQLATQVEAQVAAQIGEHIPVTLREQINESRRELRKVSVGLENSESRRINSALRMPRDEYEPLAPVSTARGEKSAHFPANFRSLWSYDLRAAKALAHDYQLPESDMREVNLNNFMAHIGMPASACVVVMPGRR